MSGIFEKLPAYFVESIYVKKSGQFSRTLVQIALLLLFYWIRTGTDFHLIALLFHHTHGADVKELIDLTKDWMSDNGMES